MITPLEGAFDALTAELSQVQRHLLLRVAPLKLLYNVASLVGLSADHSLTIVLQGGRLVRELIHGRAHRQTRRASLCSELLRALIPNSCPAWEVTISAQVP